MKGIHLPDEAVKYQIEALGTADGVQAVWEFESHEFRRHAGTYNGFKRAIRSRTCSAHSTPSTARRQIRVGGETECDGNWCRR